MIGKYSASSFSEWHVYSILFRRFFANMGLIAICFSIAHIVLKVNLHRIRFLSVFASPWTSTVCPFSSAFLYVHIRTNQTVAYWTKVVRKKFLQRVHDFEISILSFIHKIFEQNFYQYVTVYLVRIWTYENADEKAHTFSRKSKNVKKRTKTDDKRILCKFTLMLDFTNGQSITSNEWCPHFLLTCVVRYGLRVNEANWVRLSPMQKCKNDRHLCRNEICVKLVLDSTLPSDQNKKHNFLYGLKSAFYHLTYRHTHLVSMNKDIIF